MAKLKKWQTINTRYVVNDTWLKLRADTCLTPDGHTLDPFYIFEYSDWVNCLVVDGNDNAIMIRQYRHGAKDYMLEMIGGGIDDSDTTPEEAIRRELQEELGYVGGNLFRVGVSYANPANQTNKVFSFLAVGGSMSENQTLGIGENIHVEKMPFIDVVEKMMKSGTEVVFQSLHLANLLMTLNFIRRSDEESLESLKKQI
jgi:8-oxo-dGTP pyrophosphatase MutT (NUDIX family)